jgi:hypothetical protein
MMLTIIRTLYQSQPYPKINYIILVLN